MGLIADPEKRSARATEKEDLILRFLTDEVYSRVDILSLVLGVDRVATERALKRLEVKGFVKKAKIPVALGRSIPLWGITLDGFDEYVSREIEKYQDPDLMCWVKTRWFVPEKVNLLQLDHALSVQMMAIFYPKLWRGRWISGRNLPGQNATKRSGERWPGYPDAIFVQQQNTEKGEVRWAIEVERTKKTPSRYPDIIKHHHENMAKGRYDLVFYIMPNEHRAIKMRDDFNGFAKNKLGTDLGNFYFMAMDGVQDYLKNGNYGQSLIVYKRDGGKTYLLKGEDDN